MASYGEIAPGLATFGLALGLFLMVRGFIYYALGNRADGRLLEVDEEAD